MRPNDQRIEEIVSLVVDRLKKQGLPTGGAAGSAVAPAVHVRRRGVFDDVDSAVAAARKAFEQYEAMPLATRFAVVRAMRETAMAHLEEMCQRAVIETKLGRVEDKRIKNRLAITKTPGPEFLEPIAFSGDNGLAILERAPYGVICSITPCTNPTETILCNAIGMVSGGNAVVFNAHPSARRSSLATVRALNAAAAAVGAPPNLVTAVAQPTIESATQVMLHKGINLLVVTGGKSIRGLVRVLGIYCVTDCARVVESQLFGAVLEPLGVDPACKNESRLSRLPGHFRKEKDAWQRVLYLAPEGKAVGA
ncbi:MAG: aldehyde dehydrogenase family protein [Deltaproteobacteria bacterium]